MATATQSMSVSKAALWTGRVLSGLVVALMIMSGVMKLMMTADAQKDLDPIGWSVGIMGTIGAIEIACAVLYAIPQTAVLGAILLTGYLGGACATSVRIGQYGLSFAPVIIGVVTWVALYLRDARLRSLAPIRAL
jgi:hypothetical protein